MHHSHRHAGVLAAALLAGCAAGPDFTPPAPPSSHGYAAAAEPTASAPIPLGGSQRFDPQQAVDPQWWRAFGSAELDELVQGALQANPGLAAARATLAQASALHAAQSGASRYPQVDLGASAQRQRASPAAQGQAGPAREFDLLNASVAVRYSFDLSGGNARALEALAARAEVRSHELEGVRQSLAGSVVATAITMARLSGQIQTLERMASAQEEQLQLAGERLRLGHAAPAEPLALQAQLERTRSELPALRKQLAQQRNLLAVLAGREPGAASLPDFSLAQFVLPGSLPLVVPSELARRRPDIRAAEALMRAANAEYGAAVAKAYPQIGISASLGSQALTAAALFGSGSAVWSVAGQLAQPLFRPGLAAERQAAQASFDAAAARYQGVVLASLQSVADALVALEQDALALRAHAAADGAAGRTLSLAQQRHKLGAASYLEVLDATREAQQVRLGLVSSQAQRLLDTVSLYVALGGSLPPP